MSTDCQKSTDSFRNLFCLRLIKLKGENIKLNNENKMRGIKKYYVA